MDVVYPLGRGSQWNNLELKYSLRSLERYLIGHGTIYIIGEKPLFINFESAGIHHIYAPDRYANPARNIAEKFMQAAALPHISEDFLFMNDDYFFAKPVSITSYADKMVYKRTLEESIQTNVGNSYQKHLIATLQVLRDRHFPTLNFDTHCPMVMNVRKLQAIFSSYSWDDIPYGYTLRSIYCNDPANQSIPKVQEPDHKINHPYTESSWRAIMADFPSSFPTFSIGDAAITYGFKRFMESQYPTKSRFEL